MKAFVMVFALLVLTVFYKPTEVKAYNNGCDIVSPNVMLNCYYDKPVISSGDTWDSWISWYAGMGYTYTGYTSIGDGFYWMNLQAGGVAYYAYLGYWDGAYHALYYSWVHVLEPTGDTYFYTNRIGLIYRNTWVHTRINNDSYQATDSHGYFVFNDSGRMCTGWHKDTDGYWYYMRMDHSNNTDGPCMKVGTDCGFVWETVKNSTTYSEGLYRFTGINIKTNVYRKDTSGNYNYIGTSTKKHGVGDGNNQVRPLAIKSVSADTSYVNSHIYNSSGLFVNTTVPGSVTGSQNITILNGDYRSYSVNEFNYYIDRRKYSMTSHHKMYIPSTGEWKEFATTTQNNIYFESKYTPPYSKTPAGCHNHSRDWNDGWTVSGNGTFNVYYYPNKYRLTVDLNKGSGSTEPNGTSGNFDIAYGANMDLGTPTRTGYTFNGWKIIYNNSTGSSLSGNLFTMGYNKSYSTKDYTSEATVTVQAQWTANTYTITYNGNGGIISDTAEESYSNTATFDSTYHVNSNTFIKDGFWFLGWSTTKDGTVSSTWLPDNDIIMRTPNNVTLYAVWQKVQWTASGTKENGDTVFGVNTAIAENVTNLSSLCNTIKSTFSLNGDISINPWESGVDYATPLNYVQYGDMNLYLYTNIENGEFTKVTYEFDTATGIETVVKELTTSNDNLTVQIPTTLAYDEVYSVKVTIENPDENTKASQMLYFTYKKMNLDELLSRIRNQ